MASGDRELLSVMLERPSLEYQHAFDFCAAEAQRSGRAVAVLASSPFYARELLMRLEGCAVRLVPVGSWSAAEGEAAREAGWVPGEESSVNGWETDSRMAPDRREPRHLLSDGLLPGSPAGCVIWAELHPQDVVHTCGIGDVLAAGGKMYAITCGWLARFLSEWRSSARRPPGLGWTRSWLRLEGLRAEAMYGFHGPCSIAWGLAGRLAARLGRDDWADRCQAAMRAAYVVTGWQALLAPVAVLVAEEGSSIEN